MSYSIQGLELTLTENTLDVNKYGAQLQRRLAVAVQMETKKVSDLYDRTSLNGHEVEIYTLQVDVSGFKTVLEKGEDAEGILDESRKTEYEKRLALKENELNEAQFKLDNDLEAQVAKSYESDAVNNALQEIFQVNGFTKNLCHHVLIGEVDRINFEPETQEEKNKLLSFAVEVINDFFTLYRSVKNL